MRKLLFLTMAVALALPAQQREKGGDGDQASDLAPAPARKVVINGVDLVQLVSSSPWCSADNEKPIVVLPPTSIPPAELNQALYNLAANEPSWGLSEVKRAMRIMGATKDVSAGRYLNQISTEAQTIVARRSAVLRRKVLQNELSAYQAYIRQQTRDLQRLARELQPPQ